MEEAQEDDLDFVWISDRKRDQIFEEPELQEALATYHEVTK